jgi:hypothetical protein
MADLSITPANVRGLGDRNTGTAGAAINAGDVIRLNTSNQWVPAQSNSAVNSGNNATLAIALNSAPAANMPVEFQLGGPINPGGTVAIGKVYVVSVNAGKMAPVDDIAGGEFISVVGVGQTASQLLLGFVKSGVAAASAVT